MLTIYAVVTNAKCRVFMHFLPLWNTMYVAANKLSLLCQVLANDQTVHVSGNSEELLAGSAAVKPPMRGQLRASELATINERGPSLSGGAGGVLGGPTSSAGGSTSSAPPDARAGTAGDALGSLRLGRLNCYCCGLGHRTLCVSPFVAQFIMHV